MNFDALIIGGGVAGMQCALVLGSALTKPYAKDKRVGIVMHQRSSHLQNALFNNVLGITPGTTGKSVLDVGKEHLKKQYPQVTQILNEKVIAVFKEEEEIIVQTNKSTYRTAIAILALNYAKPFTIKGLERYIIPHKKANPAKERIQLVHHHNIVFNGVYVCGTLAGERSQFAIAAGSGASVATDILTLWNDGSHSKVHGKI